MIMMRNIIVFMFSALLALYLASSTASGMEMGLKTGKMGGISFMTGGAGKGERAEMEKMAGKYNLKIILATTSGAYLALLPITIYDSNGNQVLKAEASGPWFYARLPEGRYTIKVTRKGKEKGKTVQLGRGFELVMFHWNV